MNRRSQSRRSSNTLPIRPVTGLGPKPAGGSISNSLSTSAMSSAQKRSSSIPRPSFGLTKPSYGRNPDQSLAVGTTPSKATGNARLTAATPQIGVTTPQSRGNMINVSTTATSKPYLKETRNLSDKNLVLEMMKNVASFYTDAGYPDVVSHKEIQKIDKQSFVKYFNFVYQYIDPNYQLGPRFNEDDLIRNVKDLGYCGTLAKSALVSIGALHSTSQITGLLSWLVDLVRALMVESDDSYTIEKEELRIMMNHYTLWCMDQETNVEEDFRNFYKAKHEIEDGLLEMLDSQIKLLVEQKKSYEKNSSQIDELKEEAKKEDRKVEEITAKEGALQQRLKELYNEEKHLLQRLEDIKEKTAASHKEIAQLHIDAKNCKVSADEARRIKQEIAANKRDYAAALEQREQVAKLVEKRELQLAKLREEEIKSERELNVSLMDMGMAAGQDGDRKEALKLFLDSKMSALSDMESQSIAMSERKERVLAEISQIKMELKHSELTKARLDEQLQSVKADRDEMERLYLSQMSEYENLSAAPRSDPIQMRQQYELETLQQKFAEQKAQMAKQERDLQLTIAKHAKELKDGGIKAEEIKSKAIAYYERLGKAYTKAIVLAETESPGSEALRLPKRDF